MTVVQLVAPFVALALLIVAIRAINLTLREWKFGEVKSKGGAVFLLVLYIALAAFCAAALLGL